MRTIHFVSRYQFFKATKRKNELICGLFFEYFIYFWSALPFLFVKQKYHSFGFQLFTVVFSSWHDFAEQLSGDFPPSEWCRKGFFLKKSKDRQEKIQHSILLFFSEGKREGWNIWDLINFLLTLEGINKVLHITQKILQGKFYFLHCIWKWLLQWEFNFLLTIM